MTEMTTVVKRYDKYAKYYDEAVRACRGNNSMIYQMVKKYHSGIFSGNLLDVGCGTGLTSEPFANQSLKIFGVDAAPGMIREFLKKGFAEKASLADLNNASLPFSDDFFDYAVSNGVLCLLPRLDKIFKEVGRVMKEGGLYCFTVEDINHCHPESVYRSGMGIHRHSLEYLEYVTKEARFQIVRHETYTEKISCIDGALMIFTAILCQKE
jgi:predicted TPR repeat methyltransferase